MNTLLMVAVVLIALAVVAQAGVLVSMYLMSRRITTKAEALMDESRRIMAPVESITSNLKTVSNDLTEAGKIAREQAVHIKDVARETQNDIRADLADVRARVLTTVDEASNIVMRPLRQYRAVMAGIGEGLRVFFGRGRRNEIIVRDERPAA